jgi:hypothetical protein
MASTASAATVDAIADVAGQLAAAGGDVEAVELDYDFDAACGPGGRSWPGSSPPASR